MRERFVLARAVLWALLATACESTGVPTSPAPTLASTRYRVSGIVTDAADAAPIAGATVVLRHSDGRLTTRTDADGVYVFSFLDKSGLLQSQFPTIPPGSLGLLIATDGAHSGHLGRGHWTTVQLLAAGTPDLAHNVRLRPVRTLAAGHSMGLSVEPDSSLLWNQEWDPWEFVSFDTLHEQFRVSVETDGVLTIDVRSEAGANVASLTCYHVGCPASGKQARTVSIAVQAGWSPIYFSVEIPRASAPQRYEIRTSLR